MTRTRDKIVLFFKQTVGVGIRRLRKCRLEAALVINLTHWEFRIIQDDFSRGTRIGFFFKTFMETTCESGVLAGPNLYGIQVLKV